jgi:hypothetical protein
VEAWGLVDRLQDFSQDFEFDRQLTAVAAKIPRAIGM